MSRIDKYTFGVSVGSVDAVFRKGDYDNQTYYKAVKKYFILTKLANVIVNDNEDVSDFVKTKLYKGSAGALIGSLLKEYMERDFIRFTEGDFDNDIGDDVTDALYRQKEVLQKIATDEVLSSDLDANLKY